MTATATQVKDARGVATSQRCLDLIEIVAGTVIDAKSLFTI